MFTLSVVYERGRKAMFAIVTVWRNPVGCTEMIGEDGVIYSTLPSEVLDCEPKAIVEVEQVLVGDIAYGVLSVPFPNQMLVDKLNALSSPWWEFHYYPVVKRTDGKPFGSLIAALCHIDGVGGVQRDPGRQSLEVVLLPSADSIPTKGQVAEMLGRIPFEYRLVRGRSSPDMPFEW